MQGTPFVSVIVPVFNDAVRLRSCLTALKAQIYPQDRFEVLVVDNGSEPPLAATVALPLDVVFVEERTRGSYAARNSGAARARGDVLAFTDSDCLPDAHWLEAGVQALRRLPNGGLVGGRVKVFVARPGRPRAVELYEIATAFPQRRNVEEERYAVTANAFTTRATFERVGPFDASLQSGGDREWGARVFRAGLPVVYAHDSVVLHPARDSLQAVGRKMQRVAHGHHHLARRRPLPQRLLEWPRILLPPIRSFRTIWRAEELSGAGQRMAAAGVAVAAKYHCAWARVRYALGYGRPDQGTLVPEQAGELSDFRAGDSAGK